MFALHNLGWNDFQTLCHTITREILGQTVGSFLDARDGGRDGAFAGTWSSTGRESLSGQFVIQCKFTSRINYRLKISDLSDEVEKARKLVEGIVLDYNESLLNTIEPFTTIQPTSENIAKVIFERFKSDLNSNEIRLKQVRVWESPTNSASYSDAVLAI